MSEPRTDHVVGPCCDWHADDFAEIVAALAERDRRIEELREALSECWGEAYIGLLAPDGPNPMTVPQNMGRALEAVISVARAALAPPTTEGETG